MYEPTTVLKCRLCGDTIKSKYEGQFTKCSCESCFIDETEHYRRIGGNANDYVILSMNALQDAFDFATFEGHKFIGMLFELPDHKSYELIINPHTNFEAKRKYIRKMYDDRLVNKFAKDVKIVDYASGTSPEEIVKKLKFTT